FILVQILLPSTRPAWATPLSPANVAQAFFWVQLVLVPVLFGFYGLSQGTLPHMPSREAINWAIVLHIIAYICFCASYQCFHRSLAPQKGDAKKRAAPYVLIVPFLVVGVVGFFLAYGSIGGYVEY